MSCYCSTSKITSHKLLINKGRLLDGGGGGGIYIGLQPIPWGRLYKQAIKANYAVSVKGIQSESRI